MGERRRGELNDEGVSGTKTRAVEFITCLLHLLLLSTVGGLSGRGGGDAKKIKCFWLNKCKVACQTSVMKLFLQLEWVAMKISSRKNVYTLSTHWILEGAISVLNVIKWVQGAGEGCQVVYGSLWHLLTRRNHKTWAERNLRGVLCIFQTYNLI